MASHYVKIFILRDDFSSGGLKSAVAHLYNTQGTAGTLA